MPHKRTNEPPSNARPETTQPKEPERDGRNESVVGVAVAAPLGHSHLCGVYGAINVCTCGAASPPAGEPLDLMAEFRAKAPPCTCKRDAVGAISENDLGCPYHGWKSAAPSAAPPEVPTEYELSTRADRPRHRAEAAPTERLTLPKGWFERVQFAGQKLSNIAYNLWDLYT